MKSRCSVFLMLSFLVFFSCEITGSYDEPTGTVTVTLPTSRALTATLAETYSSTFEILVYNASYHNSVVLSSDDTGPFQLVVPVGSYKVLCLAGVDDSILGSGVSSEIEVISGQNTPVSLTLASVDAEFIAPVTVNCGESFELSTTGNLNNPVLRIDSSGYSFEIYDEENNSEFMTLNSAGETWNASLELTAPLSPITVTYQLYSFNQTVKLVDPDYSIDSDIDYFTQIGWDPFGFSMFVSELIDELQKDVEFVVGSSTSGITVDISWQ